MGLRHLNNFTTWKPWPIEIGVSLGMYIKEELYGTDEII